MNIQYLGTAAAEGFPALFCQCAACKAALEQGGKNIRTRSSVLLNGHVLIDISQDVLMQKLTQGLDLAGVDALLLTHSHTDHLDAAELTRRSTAHYCHIPDEKPLQVYGNAKAARLVEDAFLLEFGSKTDPSVQMYTMVPWQTAACGELAFTAIPALHDPAEDCLLYLIEEAAGATMLYANDTALPNEGIFAGIAQRLSGKKLDFVSMDCTHGPQPGSSHHMGIAENAVFRARLEAAGCCGPNTIFLATHIGHNSGALHAPLEEALSAHGILPACDGSVFNF